MEDLKTLKLQVALLRAGCLLAIEGQGRVTSSELLFRAKKQQGIDALASTVGQLLGSLGIPSSTSKGKTRFLMDPDYLGPLIVDLESQVETMEERAEEVLASVGNIQARLAPLEERFERIYRQQQRERQLEQYLKEHRPFMSRNPFLEQEYQRVRDELARQQKLKEYTQRMQEQLESQSELEEKKEKLSERYQELEARRKEVAQEEKALAQEEEQLEKIISQLKVGRAWASLATLHREIAQAEEELAEVKEEIHRHRSWLERLLRRKEGGEP